MDTFNRSGDRKYSTPACAICDEQGTVTVTLEMPGVRKEGLDVKMEGNSLSITGMREPPEFKGRYILRERRLDSYRKEFTMDDTIDREKVSAEFANGILTLKLKIKEAAKPRKIEIA